MMIFLVAMMYASLAGSIWGPVNRQRKSVCIHTPNGTCDLEDGHWFLAGIVAILWPIMVFPAIGYLLTKNLTLGAPGLSRTERRRKREIDEANHKKELARIAREEDEHLTKQLEANKR